MACRPNTLPEKTRWNPLCGGLGLHSDGFPANGGQGMYCPVRRNTLQMDVRGREMWDLTVPPRAGTDGKTSLVRPKGGAHHRIEPLPLLETLADIAPAISLL